MKFFNLILFIGLSTFALAPNLSFYGTLKSFDKSSATIKLESGATIKVLKTSLATPVDGLIAGKAKVIATLSVEELSDLNPDFMKVVPKDPKSIKK